MKHITKIKAKYIESCTFNKSNSSIVIGGIGVQSGDKKGFYRLNISDKKITKLITSDDLNNIELQKPYSAFFNSDETILYFVGSLKGQTNKNFGFVNAYPSALFSYNLKTGEIINQFEIKDTFITDLSLTYK